MELQEIDVFIDADGNVRIEVRGVQGLNCLDLTSELESALGGQVESRQMTPEALNPTPEQVEERINQRDA